jgi:predicted naringenin-chalcone synthase
VIEALENGLGLPDEALALSRESLAEAGNISSASVLLILDKTMKRVLHGGKSGERGVLMAMGPAFSAELVFTVESGQRTSNQAFADYKYGAASVLVTRYF